MAFEVFRRLKHSAQVINYPSLMAQLVVDAMTLAGFYLVYIGIRDEYSVNIANLVLGIIFLVYGYLNREKAN